MTPEELTELERILRALPHLALLRTAWVEIDSLRTKVEELEKKLIAEEGRHFDTEYAETERRMSAEKRAEEAEAKLAASQAET